MSNFLGIQEEKQDGSESKNEELDEIGEKNSE